MLVRNTALEQKTISIIKADGSKDTLTLMPRGGNAVQLPKGSRIDPDRVNEYKVFLRTNPSLDAIAAPTPAPTPVVPEPAVSPEPAVKI